MNINIVDFRPSDMVSIGAISIDSSLREDSNIEEWAELNAKQGPAFTGISDEGIVGVGGVRITHRGVGHVWAAFTPLFVLNIFTCFRFLSDALVSVEDILKLRHLRTLSRIDFPKSQRLLEHLGFRKIRYIREMKHFLYVRKPCDT